MQNGGFQSATFVFYFLALENLTLPENKTNLFRGLLGAMWQKALCQDHEKDAHNENCGFERYFRGVLTDPAAHAQGFFSLAPWTLYCPDARKEVGAYEGIPVVLTLFCEKAITEGFVKFVIAAEEIKMIGPKGKQGRVKLSEIRAYDPIQGIDWLVYSEHHWGKFVGGPVIMGINELSIQLAALDPERVTLEFHTPVRLQAEGSITDSLDFVKVFSAALRRALAIVRFHCGEDVALDEQGLLEAAAHVQIVEKMTKWDDWGRVSHSQKSHMRLGGVIGYVVYEGDLHPFLPWLALIPFIGLGKSTTFGNGVVTIS